MLDDDFGDFASSSNTLASQSQPSSLPPLTPNNQSMSLPPSINVVPSPAGSHAPSSLTPSAAVVGGSGSVGGQDKYSALRDLFGSTSSETPSVAAFESEPK